MSALLTERERAAELARSIREQHGLPVRSRVELLRGFGVPAREANLVLSPELERTPAVVAVERVATGQGCLVVLAGPRGCGKTVAASSVFRERWGVFMSAFDLARIPYRDDEGNQEPDPVRGWLQASVLVIDEAGAQHSPSGYAANRFIELVIRREAEKLPTIVTTNLPLRSPKPGVPGFADVYGARVVSRIDGDPIGWVNVEGPDQRRGARGVADAR